MTASEAAAWWGAVIATFVLAWDIMKWARSGVRLRIRATPNMQVAGDATEEKLVHVEVVNRGDRTTTITHWGFCEFASTLDRLRGKRESVGIVPYPNGPALPFELEPGKRWAATVNQAGVLSQMSGGQVFCVIMHSGSDKEATNRVRRLQ